MQIKTTRGTTLHHPAWPSLKSLQTGNAEEGWRKWNPYHTFGGNANWCNTMEKSVEIPQNTKNRITLDPAILLLGISPEKT